MLEPDDRPFKGQYQEWCRLQMQFAHHDIWWVKKQQFVAGNSTLLLLSATVAASRLLGLSPDTMPTIAKVAFSILGGIVAALGGLYTWDLWKGLVAARERAKAIAEMLYDYPENVFAGAKEPVHRHREFPAGISFVEMAAWGVTMVYLKVSPTLVFVFPTALWLVVLGWGLRSVPD